MALISVSIMTPDQQVFKEDAEFVVVPGAEGELGILPGHTDLLAALISGKMRIHHEGRIKSFHVSGGFVRVSPVEVKVFTPVAKNEN
jgi:F-type H+-transporting ATPase subunit epsilon